MSLNNVENFESVGVVVLTFNRINLLKITLCKIFEQSYKNIQILVVDNGSTDGTREYLEELENVTVKYLPENLGPAGGFYEGIKYFAENTTVDYVWAMDDDFFPSATCLKILMSEANQKDVLFPYVREKDFAFRKEPGWWGVLIPMEIIKKVGYPLKELFFWSEDTEYLQHRIRDVHGFSNKWISQAKGVHFTKRGKNARPPWKYYYEVRNVTYSRLHIRKLTFRRTFKLFRSWAKLFGMIILRENNKKIKMRWFFIGLYDGVTKHLGKKIDPSS